MSGGPPFRLRVRVGPRSKERFPEEDEALGVQLSALLAGTLARGLPRPAMLILREQQVDWFDIVPLMKVASQHRVRMLSAIAGQAGVQTAVMLGTFTLRQRGAPKPQRALVCYLEWPDNRWWTSWRMLGPNNAPITEAARVRRAIDGSPRPGGVGGWFATARRLNLRLRMQKHPQQAIH